MPESTAVLILAREELISALLGLLIESTGHKALFADTNERSEDAMRRLRPPVVLVDCDHQDCTEDLVNTAREVGARLILFSASRDAEYVRQRAALSHSQSFTFPIDPPVLDSLIRDKVA
ncbi:hypothetical protein BH23GEM1_BH23GEM1_00150 [soil metagenome]